MFGRKTQSRSGTAPRAAHLNVEPLEDRLAPHAGIALFSEGITPNAGLTGIVAGPDDNVWFAEFSTSRIGRIGGVGRTGASTEFTLPAGRGPLHLTVGPDNLIYFTENTGDRIGRINPLAGSDAAIQASIVEFTVPGAGSKPHDIVAGPDGALWFTQSGSDQIGRITTAGVVTEFAVPGAGSMPSGIAVGSDGALWFTQSGSGQIGRITTAGVVTEFTIPVPNPAAFSDPEDIVSGPGGHLYFTDFGRDQIGRITTSGQITQFSLPLGRGPLQIVATPDANLYFTEAGSSRIGRLPANALNPGQPTSGAPPLKEFDFIARDSVPLGLAVVGPDDIFFTLNNGNAIGAFASHLTQISIASAGPNLNVFDINLNSVLSYTPFAGYQGNLNLAVMDILPPGGATGVNGVPDAIVGIASGPPHVKIFDGGLGTLMASFFAFDPGFRGGVTVGAADVNGDGFADVVAAAGTHVKVIDGTKLGQVQANGVIADSALLASFFAFPFGAVSSVSLAVGDLDRDGRADIAIGSGPGSRPHVKVVNATRITQVDATGLIAESALLASFFAFGPGFTGGVFVAVPYNVVDRNLVLGAGPGASAHVKVVDADRFRQVLPDGQIADSALLASFFAFPPSFSGGVRVASDDLINADGVAEIFAAAGPGAGPHVKVIDGSKVNQVQANGVIGDGALLSSTFIGSPTFSGGVSIAADADHRDAGFGPPNVNVAKSRGDVNDMYIFQSPANAANTVLGMTVSPFSSSVTPNAFDPNVTFDQRISNRDVLNTTDDIVFRYTFGAPDPNNNNKQDLLLRALPAAKFAGVGGVLAKGFTKENVAVRGVGGTGAQLRAAEQADPFFFDASGFNSRTLPAALLNHNTAAEALAAGDYPRGTGTTGPNGEPFYAPGGVPNYNAQSFFAGSNTLALVLEIPSAALTGAAVDSVSSTPYLGYWGRAEVAGVQTDRMGRPGINTALIPAVPRGINFPADGSTATRADIRDLFNAGHPRDDRADFADDIANVLAAFYPAGRPTSGADPAADLAQAQVVASLLAPDILVFRPSSTAGFFGDTVGTLGQTGFFLAGGRKFSDNIIDTELQILTDADTPFNLDGGTNLAPFVMTQNVRDHNGQNLPDGSIDLPLAQGGMGTGQRPIAFPYIGAPNVPAAAIPNPPGSILP